MVNGSIQVKPKNPSFDHPIFGNHQCYAPSFLDKYVIEIWNNFWKYFSMFVSYCYERSKAAINFLSTKIKVSCFNLSFVKELKFEFSLFKREVHYHVNYANSGEAFDIMSRQPLAIKC